MFEDYKCLLQPTSILDIVDEDILRAMMQGFFYREHTGLTFLCFSGDDLTLRLDPFPDREAERNTDTYHPFCERFRSVRERDQLCENCDAARATVVKKTGLKARYPCHMGLIDFAHPIRIGDSVMGVLFAGQRVPIWDAKAMTRVHARVQDEANDIASDLIPLLGELDEYGSRLTDEDLTAARMEVDALELAFDSFADTLQRTVSAVYRAKLGEAMQEAIVEVDQHLSSGPILADDAWFTATEEVLAELSSLLGGVKLAVLTRRNSRFECVASSFNLTRGDRARVPVIDLITLPIARWITELDTQLADSLSRWFKPRQNGSIYLYRLDAVGPPNSALSSVFVADAVTDSQELLAACFQSLAYRAHVGRLFQRMRSQQEQFAREVTFTGHTLKTPIQSAIFQLRKLTNYAEGSELSRADARRLSVSLKESLLLAVFDAMQLQTATAQNEDLFCVYPTVELVATSLGALAANRNISIKTQAEDGASTLQVNGIESHIRVALSNVIDNAVKYSFRGKEVRINVKRLTASDMLISISNYGVGFDDNAKKHLFSYGQRLDTQDKEYERQGTGLGLHQAKTFIEQCGGSIDIDSYKLSKVDHDDIRHLVTVKITLPVKN